MLLFSLQTFFGLPFERYHFLTTLVSAAAKGVNRSTARMQPISEIGRRLPIAKDLWMTAFSINQTLISTWRVTFHGRSPPHALQHHGALP